MATKAKNTDTAPAQDKELVKVTLSKEHTHKRERLPAGTEIEVTAAQKKWLEGQGKIGTAAEVSNG